MKEGSAYFAAGAHGVCTLLPSVADRRGEAAAAGRQISAQYQCCVRDDRVRHCARGAGHSAWTAQHFQVRPGILQLQGHPVCPAACGTTSLQGNCMCF